MKTAIIAGGGPAGLTAAYELLKRTDIHPIVLEETDAVGGISRTVNFKGNRMDIGGHRFFSKNDDIMRWWLNIMDIQGAPALDDVLLARDKTFDQSGADPETQDDVMLVRDRVSRIFFKRHFFDYPISVKWKTFAGIGLLGTIRAGFGYLWAILFKKPETSLENFYINRFGRPLYEMFFEDYTKKVWGVHPAEIGADWGSQRVKGLSVRALLKDILTRPFRKKAIGQKNVETSLIEQFIYPKFGPGQLWEKVASEVRGMGGEVLMCHKVAGVRIRDEKVCGVVVQSGSGSVEMPCDFFFSSMPIKDLVSCIDGIDVPEEIMRISSGLPYRDFITVGLLVKKLRICNTTRILTYDNRIPDTWIYVQERDVNVGRLQVFNNWSPYMVADYKETMYIGMEYFCREGDELWNMSEKDFIDMAVKELVKINVLDAGNVLDAVQIKVRKAYPAYFGTYCELDKVRHFLDRFSNMYCIGRNGQHRYNNMDHSMLTAIEAVDNIVRGCVDKTGVWNVNTETEYHESK